MKVGGVGLRTPVFAIIMGELGFYGVVPICSIITGAFPTVVFKHVINSFPVDSLTIQSEHIRNMKADTSSCFHDS